MPSLLETYPLSAGLSLQTLSCLSAATGLAFMKLSSLSSSRLLVLRWRWWVGFLFLGVFATTLEAVVFSLVPLTTVAPFAGLTIVFSLMLATSGLITSREQLQPTEVGGAALVVVGVMLVGAFGPRDTIVGDGALEHVLGMVHRPLRLAAVQDEHGSLHEALSTLTHWRFIVLATVGLIAVGAWLVVLKSPALRQHKLLLTRPALVTTFSAFTAATCGALSQTFLKVVAMAVRISLQDPSVSRFGPWRQPQMWLAVSGLLICAPTQLYLLDVTLASGAVSFAVPVYQVMLISLEVGAGAIFFLELEDMRPLGLLAFATGVMVASAGLFILSRGGTTSGTTRPPAEARPLKGDVPQHGELGLDPAGTAAPSTQYGSVPSCK